MVSPWPTPSAPAGGWLLHRYLLGTFIPGYLDCLPTPRCRFSGLLSCQQYGILDLDRKIPRYSQQIGGGRWGLGVWWRGWGVQCRDACGYLFGISEEFCLEGVITKHLFRPTRGMNRHQPVIEIFPRVPDYPLSIFWLEWVKHVPDFSVPNYSHQSFIICDIIKGITTSSTIELVIRVEGMQDFKSVLDNTADKDNYNTVDVLNKC